MDNRVFNVNGRGHQLLSDCITLALDQGGYTKLDGYRIEATHGLILYGHIPEGRKKEATRFLAPHTPSQVAPIVIDWLTAQFLSGMKFSVACNWDGDCDHDGSNSKGWRCYVGDWGHVADDWGVVCAVIPAYMWHGK